MATYVISDIHGCYDEYIQLLESIGFSEQDRLYILGDCVDRGPNPIKVLKDVMQRKNVVFLLGNHDYFMHAVLWDMATAECDENGQLPSESKRMYKAWCMDGGSVTCNQFMELSIEEQLEILDFVEAAKPYEELCLNGKRFVLAHAGISNYTEGQPLSEYDLDDFLFGRPDYSKRYFMDPNTFLVSGHTPTPHIRSDEKPLVYEGKGHIAVDCGCVFGGRLAAYCLENGEITYVDSHWKYTHFEPKE